MVKENKIKSNFLLKEGLTNVNIYKNCWTGEEPKMKHAFTIAFISLCFVRVYLVCGRHCRKPFSDGPISHCLQEFCVCRRKVNTLKELIDVDEKKSCLDSPHFLYLFCTPTLTCYCFKRRLWEFRSVDKDLLLKSWKHFRKQSRKSCFSFHELL